MKVTVATPGFPRVPAVNEMASLLEAAAARLPSDQLWANPDRGLKTHQWPEVTSAIETMVAAAQSPAHRRWAMGQPLKIRR